MSEINFKVNMIWSCSNFLCDYHLKKKLHKWLGVHSLHFNEDDDDEKEDESLPATKRNETIEGRLPAWEDDADEEERWM